MNTTKFRTSLIGGASAIALLAVVGSTTPSVAAGDDWSGLYFGANVGYGEADLEGCALSCPVFDPTETILLERLDPAGLTGGIHGGFNYQLNDVFPDGQDLIIGVEGDVMYLDWQDLIAGPPTAGGTPTDDYASADIEMLASLRARLGIKTNTDTLYYVTGGVAMVEGEARSSFGGGSPESVASLDDTGTVVGGGIEFPLNGLVIARIEGLYYMFGGTSPFTGSGSGSGGPSFAGIEDIFVVRAGITIPLN